MSWQISLHPEAIVVRRYLLTHRIWAAYALNDLRPPFRERSQFYLAEQGDEWALLLVYHTATFTALLPFGPVEGVAALLEAIPELPERCIISNGVGEYRPLLDRWYSIGPEELIYRMRVDAAAFKPFEGFVECEALDMDNLPELSAFYTMHSVPTFSPDQLSGGVYTGIRRHGLLVAVGGTHFVDPQDGIAAIGNVYADSMLRGNGYVQSVVSALVEQLLSLGCREIVINVPKVDFRSVQVYEQLGFVAQTLFWEAPATQR